MIQIGFKQIGLSRSMSSLSKFNLNRKIASLDSIAVYDATDTSSLRINSDGSGGSPSISNTWGFLFDKNLIGNQSVSSFINSQANLIIDSSFDNSGNWSITGNGGWTVNNSLANAIAATGYISQNIGLVNGKTYELTIDVTSYTMGQNVVWLGNASFQLPQAIGTYTIIGKATAASVYIGHSGAGGVTASYDNISVKEVPGIHITQETTAQRPTLQAGGVLRLDGVDDNFGLEFPGGAGPSTLTVLCGIKSTDTQGILFNDGSADPYAGCWSSGNTTLPTHVNTGSPTTEINGVAQTTRDGIYNAAIDGSWNRFVVRGVTATSMAEMHFSAYGSPWYINADLGPRIWLGTEAVYAANQALLDAWVMQGLV